MSRKNGPEGPRLEQSVSASKIINQSTPNTKYKPPTKHELCLALLIERGANGIKGKDATEAYGESCLNTTISELFRFYNLCFERIREPHIHRHGGKTSFTRYILTPASLESAIKIYEQLKARRLQPVHKGTNEGRTRSG